jgi:hypothetical protein
MKTKATPIVIGALLTLLLWVLAFAVLNAIYQGNLPWLLTGLAALLCPLAGGYLAARLSGTNSVRLGALSGLSAGLVLLLAGVLASRLAPNTTLTGIGLVVVGAVGGGIGTLLSPGRRVSGK